MDVHAAPGPVAAQFAARRMAWEERELSPAAARSYPADRLSPEEDCGLRTPLQRDRDRIVHAKSFRRLKHKTQVFVAPEGDHYRTRLTHTFEVCGIARTVDPLGGSYFVEQHTDRMESAIESVNSPTSFVATSRWRSSSRRSSWSFASSNRRRDPTPAPDVAAPLAGRARALGVRPSRLGALATAMRSRQARSATTTARNASSCAAARPSAT